MSPEEVGALIAALLAVLGIALVALGIIRGRFLVIVGGLALVVLSVVVGLSLANIDYGYYFPHSHL